MPQICPTHPQYTKFFAAGLGTPYARQWVPAEPYNSIGKLISQPPGPIRASYHVQIRVLGEGYYAVPVIQAWLDNPVNPPFVPGTDYALDALTWREAADEVSTLEGLSRETASILKVRLSWKDWTGRARSVDFDLGAGVDIITPPSNWMQAELLVPVAGSELQLPPRVLAVPLGFATSVISRIDCFPYMAERNFNLTFTDTVYLDREGPAGDSVLIPRRRTTNRYEVTGDGQPLGITETVWDRNPPGSVADAFGRLPIGSSTPIPAGNLAPTRGTSSTPRIAIPGSTNAFIHTLDSTVDQATVSLIQELAL